MSSDGGEPTLAGWWFPWIENESHPLELKELIPKNDAHIWSWKIHFPHHCWHPCYFLLGGVYLNLNSAGAWAQKFCGINFKPCPGSQDIRILSLRLFTNKKSHSSCPIFGSQVQGRWFPPDVKAVKVALDVNQLNPRSLTQPLKNDGWKTTFFLER